MERIATSRPFPTYKSSSPLFSSALCVFLRRIVSYDWALSPADWIVCWSVSFPSSQQNGPIEISRRLFFALLSMCVVGDVSSIRAFMVRCFFFLLRSVRSAVVPLARVSALYRWLPFYRGTPMEKKKKIYIYVDNRSSYLRLGRLFLFLFFFYCYWLYCVLCVQLVYDYHWNLTGANGTLTSSLSSVDQEE